MDFLKRNWSTLILIGAIATYLGISMGTDNCPMCVVSDAVLGTSLTQENGSRNAAIVGEEKSPDWSVTTISGREISAEAAKGKVSIIVYWATWCAPCREEVPALIALRNEFSAEQLEIIGVSLDDASKSIDSFVTSHKINYEIARNNESLEQAFGPVRYIPTLVVVDPDGKVQQRYTGLVGHDVIRGQVEMLLENHSQDLVAGS